MRVFVAHAKVDRVTALAIAAKLRAKGASAFVDEDSLAPSGDFDNAIRKEILRSDVFAFLLSPASIAAGRYVQTEIEIARKRWPNPAGRVLVVMVTPMALDGVDPYLTAVGTILRPKGDVATETAQVAYALARRLVRRRWARRALAAVLVTASAAVSGRVIEAARGATELATASPSPSSDATVVAEGTAPGSAASSVDANDAPARSGFVEIRPPPDPRPTPDPSTGCRVVLSQVQDDTEFNAEQYVLLGNQRVQRLLQCAGLPHISTPELQLRIDAVRKALAARSAR